MPYSRVEFIIWRSSTSESALHSCCSILAVFWFVPSISKNQEPLRANSIVQSVDVNANEKSWLVWRKSHEAPVKPYYNGQLHGKPNPWSILWSKVIKRFSIHKLLHTRHSVQLIAFLQPHVLVTNKGLTVHSRNDHT